MPIVFIHGVATREAPLRPELEALLRRYVAPALAPDPENVAIFASWWGEIGAQFAWGGLSRPRTPLFGMGSGTDPTSVEQALTVGDLSQALSGLPEPVMPAPPSGLAPAGPSEGTPGSTFRLRDLSPDQLSDLLTTIATRTATTGDERVRAILAADSVAHDPRTTAGLATSPTSADEIALVRQLLAAEMGRTASDALAGMGVGEWTNLLGDRLGEIVSRAETLPGMVATRVVGEFRKPLNDFVTLFFGDVFFYLGRRQVDDHRPGPIPQLVIDDLKRASDNGRQRGGEPLVVLSHSMGGQVMYDLVSYFLPRDPHLAGLRIDFWGAAASQVGLFEEMKLFLASNPAYSKATNAPVPFPDRRILGGWWNVWDYNDFISYSVAGIVDGVDDEAYSSGTSGLHAHSSYLDHPTFFRRFADKLRAAKARNWWRT